MLNAKNFGLASGIVWGVIMFVFTWVGMAFPGYGTSFFAFFKDIYPVYDLTPAGSIIGLFYGFIDGFIGGYLLIWVYNKLQKIGQN